jgi:hypothetical protein
MSLWLRIEETRNLAALSMFVLSFADVSNLIARRRESMGWSGSGEHLHLPVYKSICLTVCIEGSAVYVAGAKIRLQ